MSNSKTAYLAVCYICNENCIFCPCSQNEKRAGMITPFSDLTAAIEQFAEEGINKLVISGGEPTLHPDLAGIIGFAQRIGMAVVLLSNGERFNDTVFFRHFGEKVCVPKLTVITTLHSHLAQEHERANQTPHSFLRSVRGLLNLIEAGANVIVKHCITKANYRDLSDFYAFCSRTFPDSVSLQMCSIDYCGIPQDQLEAEMLSFVTLRPYLEKMFDSHILCCEKGSSRNLYCINIPLCSCDVFYWKFLRMKNGKTYESYKDPRKNEITSVENNVGTSSEICGQCKVYHLCNGTYKTAFEAFGNRIIRVYEKEE